MGFTACVSGTRRVTSTSGCGSRRSVCKVWGNDGRCSRTPLICGAWSAIGTGSRVGGETWRRPRHSASVGRNSTNSQRSRRNNYPGRRCVLTRLHTPNPTLRFQNWVRTTPASGQADVANRTIIQVRPPLRVTRDERRRVQRCGDHPSP